MRTRMLIMALALVVVITAAPGYAKGPKHSYGGDVCNYEFASANFVETGVNLCWEPVCEYGIYEAEKFSVEISGTLDFSFGTADPVIGEEIEFDFGTASLCIDIPFEDITEELEDYFWEEYELLPADLNSYAFDMSAKVKGLDPSRKFGWKRQDNCFSEPVELGILEWNAELPIEQ